MCKVIQETKEEPDTLRILAAYEKHLYPFLSKFSKEEAEDIGTNIFYRFQRNCNEFKRILDKLNPLKGDWVTVAEKPQTTLDKIHCINFLEHKDLSYLEFNGDTVKLRLDNGYWIDTFKDGTYSKLAFHWVNECEFDIEFIESNNVTRKNFSKRGDKYRYQVLSKNAYYYDMSVEIVGKNSFALFRIYY